MGFTLQDATLTLMDSVLAFEEYEFEPDRAHRAILAAAYEFSRKTQCNRASVTINLSADDSTIDLSSTSPFSTAGGFTRDQFLWADIGFVPVRKVGYHTIAWESVALQAGKPSRLAFKDDSTVVLNRKCDQAYSLTWFYRKRAIQSDSFDVGGGIDDQIDLNLPDEWAYDVIWYGAKARLLAGIVDAQVELREAQRAWSDLLAEAMLAFADDQIGSDDDRISAGDTRPPRTEGRRR